MGEGENSQMNNSMIAERRSYLFIDTLIGGVAFVLVAALIPTLFFTLYVTPIGFLFGMYVIYVVGPWLSDVVLLRILPSLIATCAIVVSANRRKDSALRISFWASWATILVGLLCIPPWPGSERGFPYFDHDASRGGYFFLDLPKHTYRIDTAPIGPLIGLVAQVAMVGVVHIWRRVTGRSVSFSETVWELLPALIMGFAGGFFLALVLPGRVMFR